jgi:hypothetical protein
MPEYLPVAAVLGLLPLALWTLVRARGMAAVLGFAGCGLILALAWLARGAPLVALAQLLGTGVAALLLGRAARLPGAAELADPADRPAPALRAVIALLCAGLAAVLAFVLPDPPAPQPAEAVAEVLLGSRLPDTLVALALLPVAGIGLWSLSRRGAAR